MFAFNIEPKIVTDLSVSNGKRRQVMKWVGQLELENGVYKKLKSDIGLNNPINFCLYQVDYGKRLEIFVLSW